MSGLEDGCSPIQRESPAFYTLSQALWQEGVEREDAEKAL